MFRGLVLDTPYVATTLCLDGLYVSRHTICRQNFVFRGLVLDKTYVVTIFFFVAYIRHTLRRQILCFEDLC
jgi:hypothetical protein